MKTVAIFKAQRTVDPVESVTIVIDQEIPEFKTLGESAHIYEEQGKKLADAFFLALPGGIVDQLICELMTRRASLFRVPLFDK